MSRRSSFVIALACAIIVCAARRDAPAQPTADDAAAEALFDEGVARRNAGDLAKACEKFRRSYKLSPARGTLLNIAECFETEGKLASAWAAYSTLADEAEAAGDRDRLTIARGKRAELEPRLAYVTIVIAAAPDGVVVHRDDSKLPAGEPTPIDAGAHTITVSAPGHRAWATELDVADGTRQQLDVPALEPLPPEPEPPLAAAPARATKRHPRAIGGMVAVGAGALGITVGLGFGVAAMRAESDADAGCDDDLMCTRRGFDRLNDARAHANRSTFFVGAGAVLVGLGAVLWLTAPAGAEVTVTPVGGPGAMGVMVGGRL